MRHKGTKAAALNPVGMCAEDDDVASPCVDICRMDENSGYCEGCQRSLEEIAFWSEFSADEKRAVLALLPARKPSP